MKSHLQGQPGILSSLVEIAISKAAARDTVLTWLQDEFSPLAQAQPAVKKTQFSAHADEADIIELQLEIEGRTLGDASRATNGVLHDIEAFVHQKSKTVTFEETSRTLTRA